jgi:tetratricopeptide (TPR) repeat protein
MKPQIFTPVLLFLIFIVSPVSFSFGQTVVTRQIADTLLRSIATEKPDTNKISNLLKIAYYQMDQLQYNIGRMKKPDSVVLCIIRQAEFLSDRLHSAEYQQKVQRCYANYDFLSGAFEVGRLKLIKVIQYYQRVGDTYQEANTWSEMGDNVYYGDKDRAPIRLYAYERAYMLFKKGHHHLEEIGAFKNMADVHFNQDKLDLAEKELLQVLAEYRQIGYQTLHYTYDLLAAVYRAKNDQKNELSCRLQMIQSMDNTGSVPQRASLIFRVVKIYRDLGRNDKALYWANKAIALYKHDDHDDMYYVITCAAAQACTNSGKYKQALTLLTKAQLEKMKSPVAGLYINFWLGHYYMQLKQFGKAEVYYLKAHQFLQKSNTLVFLRQGYGGS